MPAVTIDDDGVYYVTIQGISIACDKHNDYHKAETLNYAPYYIVENTQYGTVLCKVIGAGVFGSATVYIHN